MTNEFDDSVTLISAINSQLPLFTKTIRTSFLSLYAHVLHNVYEFICRICLDLLHFFNSSYSLHGNTLLLFCTALYVLIYFFSDDLNTHSLYVDE